MNTIPNGEEPVTRRECSIVHEGLVNEVRRSLSQIKWFIGLSTTTIVTLCSIAIVQVQSQVPTEVPPVWFVNRVEKLDATVTARLVVLETRVTSVEKAVTKLEMRVDALNRSIEQRFKDLARNGEP